MSQWWEALSVVQQIFYYIAIPFTVVLLIQAVMSIIGLGGHDADADADTDFDADTDADFDMDTDGDLSSDFHADGHFDADHDSGGHAAAAGFRFFTVRGIVAFFCIFGWSGLAYYSSGLAVWLVATLAVLSGLFAMLLIGLMFYGVRKLQSSGNINYSNAVGKSAEVYIPIPPRREGRGKVMVYLQERLVEAEAVTDGEEKLKTGENVKVVGNISSTLIVKR